MPNIQQSESLDATITFRCDSEWKRRALAAMALKGQTIQDACVEALSKHLKVPITREKVA